MPLSPGTRVGTFEIIAPLGVGGMGEVYRARDPKLQRDVAIKVVSSSVAHAPDLLARFSREAKLLASLNHPNIAAIYGFEDTGGVRAIVMELVEGPTLAERIAQGPMPLDEALPIAKQIAEALGAAHEQGVIHRDLKPANVKVRPDGRVKILDFGIAKAMEPTSLASGIPNDTTSHALTAHGIILGTAAYMSPEQARGVDVDRRADIWAFGVLLWEMLTAKQPFAGATVSDTVAALLRTEPDWATLPVETPPSILRLLQRSLQKNRTQRLDSAIVAQLEIAEALTGTPNVAAIDDAASRAVARPRPVTWALAGTVALVSMVLVLWWALKPAAVASPRLRLSAELGVEVSLQKDLGAAAILSPDGRTLVFATQATAVPSLLYVRALDQLTASALPGTENASSPFFSPDNEWIGFFADGKLKKISVTGGTVITLCDAPLGRGGTWSGDGSIVFAPSNLPKSALARVSAAGGTATPITSLASDEISQRWPQMLPDDSGVLYTSNVSDNWNDARIVVQPLPNGTPKIVQPGFYGRYVPSGHLLFVKNATVFAAPFDLKRFEVTGPAVRALDGVVADSSTGGAQFAVSQTGTAAFLQGTGYSPMVPTVWMDRAGNTLPLQSSRLDWSNPQVSPDGKRLAVDISDGKQIDVWVQDLETANLSRLTFDSADDYKPTWTPDGRRIAFTSKRDGAPNLYWQRADGSGDVQRLTRSPNEQVGASWHPSGRFMAFHEVRPQTGNDVMILSLAGDGVGLNAGTPTVFAGTPFNESEPVFSPDGRWLAYHGNEAKRTEIFVRPFPKGDGKWQISSGGGRDAAWSRARSELLFFNFVQNRIFVAPYTIAGDSLNAETARAWSTGPVGRPARPARTFAMHPDGERVVIVPVEKQKPDHVTLAFNFFDELRQIAPVKK